MSQIISNSISAPFFDTSYVKYACRFDRHSDCVCATASLSKIWIACMAEIGAPTGLVAPLGLEPKKVCTVFWVMFVYRCLLYVSGHSAVQIVGRAVAQSHSPRDIRPMQARNLFCSDKCPMLHLAFALHGELPRPNEPTIHTWLCVINDAYIWVQDLSPNVVEFIPLTTRCAILLGTGSCIV